MYPSHLADSEYHPYFRNYLDQLEERPLIDTLTEGAIKINQLFRELPVNKHEFQYAEDKWTPKEILLHIIDAERAFSYRALYIARADHADLEGFDENTFTKNSKANGRSMADLLKEYNSVRAASISLFESFSDDTLKRIGKANGNNFSVRAAGFLICGHEIHHMKVVRERYL
jgi:hypothetical protein